MQPEWAALPKKALAAIFLEDFPASLPGRRAAGRLFAFFGQSNAKFWPIFRAKFFFAQISKNLGGQAGALILEFFETTALF